MKRFTVLAIAIALTACGSSDTGTGPASGPLKMGIVSGNNQHVTAGSAQLGAPVVGQMVRLPNGTLAFHIQRAGNRLLDLLVPRAMAQTVVNGSPVPGAVVCAVSTDSVHKLTPFTPCTNTDNNGQATFFFTPSTTSGVASAQIRGTVNSEPAVFDTATATVLADTLTGFMQEKVTDLSPVTPSDSIDLDSLVFGGTDKYHNQVETTDAGFPTPRYVLLPADPSESTLQEILADQSVSVSSATSGRYAKGFTSTTARLYVWYGNAIDRFLVTVH